MWEISIGVHSGSKAICLQGSVIQGLETGGPLFGVIQTLILLRIVP